MYPLDIILASQHESVIGPVRKELRALPATIEAEFPSLSMVMSGLQNVQRPKDRPWLFVMSLSSAEDFQYMRRIRETFVGHPILALVDTADDPIGMLAAQRAGAAQVVPLPFDRDDFLAALECIGLMFGFASSNSRIIAISGVTGGCGATMLATNLAYEISAQRQVKTLLMELSLQMGMVATYLDVSPRTTTYDLLTNMDRVDLDYVKNALTPVNETLSILPGPQQLVAPREVSLRDVLQLLDFAKRIADVVVVDVPCTYDDRYFETLAAASHVLLVAEQKLPSIRAMKVVIDSLQRDVGLGVDGVQRHLVINRYNAKNREYAVENLEKILGTGHLRLIANDHQAVSGAINKGRPLRVEAPRSKPLADIQDLIKLIFASDKPKAAANGNGGVFSKIGRGLGLIKS